jgi:hypothetical protein
VCTPGFHNSVTSSCSHTGLYVCVCVCVCTIFLLFRCLVLCILNNINVHKLYHVSLSTHTSSNWGTLRLDSEKFLRVVCITGSYSQFLHSKFYFQNGLYYFYNFYSNNCTKLTLIQEASYLFQLFWPPLGRYSTGKTQHWPVLCFSLSNTYLKTAKMGRKIRKLPIQHIPWHLTVVQLLEYTWYNYLTTWNMDNIKVCTNCFVLSCHYCTFCLSLNVSKF